MLKWTKTGRDEHGWQAEGKGGRRYQIEMRKGFNVVPTVEGMTAVKYDTLEEAQEIAWGYECRFRQAERRNRRTALADRGWAGGRVQGLNAGGG